MERNSARSAIYTYGMVIETELSTVSELREMCIIS
jgi:hypothetical protein